MKQIKLALVDNYLLFGKTLSTFLNRIDGFEVTIEASTGQELIEKLPGRPVDVVLISLRAATAGHGAMIPYLRGRHPALKLIALILPGEEDAVKPLLGRGLSGYLSQGTSLDNIRRTIRGVFAGDVYKTELVWRVVRNRTADKNTGMHQTDSQEPMKIKLALVDDHTMFRQGLATVLRQVHDFDLMLEAANGQEFIDKLPRRQPDVVLLDLEMPVLDGTATADFLRENYPLIKVIVLTMHDEDRMVLHLLEKGVSGYLLKDADTAEVEKAIRKVLDDGVYLTEFVSRAMFRKMTNKPSTVPRTPTLYNSKLLLTDREKEVLALICNGLSTAEISEKIFLSPRTVEGHRLRILEKTGTKNTAGMVAYAFINGMAGIA